VVRQIEPAEAWQQAHRGELEILDLRTRQERRRHGAPPGARKVSVLRHALWPREDDTAYLCQHANRSKLTAWRGAPEIAGGFTRWDDTGLPVEHP